MLEYLRSGNAFASGETAQEINTHAASIFLAGDRAWKLKRAVRFSYLDFSTVDKRHDALCAELALNRRTAPDLYVDVVAITRDGAGHFVIGGTGEPVDWLLRMQRFPDDALLVRLAEQGVLGFDILIRLVDHIVGFHADAQVAHCDNAATRFAAVIDGNAASLANYPEILSPETATRLCDRHRSVLKSLSTLLDDRGRAGRVRHAHGDLHLFNGFVPTMERGDILGHEFMGEVVDVGRSVTKLKVGDRVVVPFPISCGACEMCQKGMFSCCENSNPNAHIAEKLLGHSPAGIFGYSHMLGGFAGGQAEYARVPFADIGPLKVPNGLSDEQVLFLSDIFPTGYMGAEMCNIKRGDVVAVWGAGPVGQFAIASAKLLGAERVIAIDRFPYRLAMATERAGATEVINYEEMGTYDALMEMTGGRGPDACIDAVGSEGHAHGPRYIADRAKQAMNIEMDRPIALREAIRACANGGTVSVIGVYAGFIDRMNRSLTIRAGQCHVQRYMKPLLERIERGEIDPSFVITHRMKLSEAAKGYDLFAHKKDGCEKVVLSV